MPLTPGYQISLQSSQRNETPVSSSASSRWRPIRGNRAIALSLVPAALAGVLFPVAQAQAPPQMLPYTHTIYAGSGTQYASPATLTGSTTTAVHGTSPGDNGSATASGVQLNGPTHIAVDSLGNVYFTDSSGPVRKVDTNGNITTFAGGLSAGTGGKAICPGTTSTIGDGCPANETSMKSGYGIAIDPASGDIYISDNTGIRIRKISHSTYLMSTVAGTGTKSPSGSTASTADGPLSTATINGTRGLAVDKHGNLYMMDEGNFAVRVANFAKGTLTTVVNTAMAKATTTTCAADATAGGVTASSASLGVAGAIAFDNQDNLFITDSTCNYVFKVAENPATGVVDGNSTLTVVMGTGTGATPGQTSLPYQLGTTVNFTPAGVVADPLGNLYVGESTGNHVWFWDHATGYMHPVFTSALTTTKGTGGLALDAWGNLYIADSAAFYIHKLSVGTNAPPATPSANPNALVHIGAADTYASVDTTLAPDFAFTAGTCNTNAASAVPPGDNTVDCGFVVTNVNPSSSAQYEQVTVSTTAGLSSVIPMTNQVFPTCQGPIPISKSVPVNGGATPVTLSFQPGVACSGTETVALAPHKYTYAIVSQPANGTLSGTAPALTYTPNAGYSGVDSFTYSVTDSNTFSAAPVSYDGGANSITLETPTPLVSTATITLQPYTAPTATPQSITVTYNTSQSITLTGTDTNNATLTFGAPSAPAHGTLTGVAPNLTYTPAASYFGADSFTFTVNDGISSSTAGIISITVNPPPPTPTNPMVSVNYQTATAVTLGATGGGPITYGVTTQPTNGTLSGTAPNLTYTPTGTYSGSDSFTYTATNVGGTSTGTVSITVQPAPLVPVAQNSTATAVSNTATPIAAIASGGNGNPLAYILVTGPAHGTLSAFSGAVATYTSASGYVGTDSFTFKATDGTVTSNTATVSITVIQAPPVANSQSVTTPFATPASITLVATGPSPITYAVVATPAHGALSGTAPNLIYTPAGNYSGADSFTFKANNGGDSNTATVSITVSAPSLPVASAQSLTANYQTATPVTLSATGLGTITYAVTISPMHGMLTGAAPTLSYTPATGYSGPDSFSFTATNPGGTSAAAAVSITVIPPAPVAQTQSVTDTYNGVLAITLTATGNGTLTYAVAALPAHGTVTVSGAVATYTPAANYTGSDSFTFTANNGSASNAARVSITILPAPPVASNLSANTNFNTPVAIPLPSGVTDTVVAQPTNGTLTVAGTTATYTPAANFAGTDTFTYTESNAGGTSNIATATITVSGGFNWSAASGGSMTATVTNGQTATLNLQISGWTSSSGVPVTLACTGAPISCNASPNPAMLKGTTAVPVTVTINTLTTSATPVGLTWVSGSGMRRPWLLILNLGWLALIVPLARKRRTIHRLLVAFVAIGILVTVSGCGGNIPEQPFGTPAGTYTFTLTASAAGATSTAQTITLIVN